MLRPNAVEFAPHLHAAAMESLATVGRWMPWCHPARTEHEGVEGYRACEEHWRAGSAYEFSAFGFRTIGFARLEIVVAEANLPNRRVAEMLGAAFEGFARKRLLLRGASIDAAMYSLVPDARS